MDDFDPSFQRTDFKDGPTPEHNFFFMAAL